MGFIEETGAAQFWRDVRVTSIYEGTNGIQAIDLVSRKLMDGGQAAFEIINEINHLCENAPNELIKLSSELKTASDTLSEATSWMVMQKNLNERLAGATPYLESFALVLGAFFHLKGAIADDKAQSRVKLASFYINHILPSVFSLCKSATAGSTDIYKLTAEESNIM